MSFASQLANLQKTASSASSSSNNNYNSNRRNNNYSRGGNNRWNNNYQNKRQRYNNKEDRDSFLRNKLLELPNLIPKRTRSNEAESETNHLAFLFVIIDELPFEDIWKSWIKQYEEETNSEKFRISILCHSKHPERIKSKWLKERLIVEQNNKTKPLSFRPEWGSVEITRAMIELFSQALGIGEHAQSKEFDSRYSCMSKDGIIPLVDQFVFLSETCLPLTTLSEFLKQIYSTKSSSWVNASNKPNNGYSRQLQWDRIHPVIPQNHVHKSDQWISLSRDHALLIIRDIPRAVLQFSAKPLYMYFDQAKASDEMYFSTLLSLAGISFHDHDNTTNPTIIPKSITYVDWSANGKNPETFTTLQEFKQVAKKGKQNGSFFGRKFIFTNCFEFKDWLNVINERMEQST